MTDPRPCPRCETELTGEKLAELAAAAPLSPSLRADEEVYHKRLQSCMICDGLREKILCAWCGCFVQFRARNKNTACPHPDGTKWSA